MKRFQIEIFCSVIAPWSKRVSTRVSEYYKNTDFLGIWHEEAEGLG